MSNSSELLPLAQWPSDGDDQLTIVKATDKFNNSRKKVPRDDLDYEYFDLGSLDTCRDCATNIGRARIRHTLRNTDRDQDVEILVKLFVTGPDKYKRSAVATWMKAVVRSNLLSVQRKAELVKEVDANFHAWAQSRDRENNSDNLEEEDEAEAAANAEHFEREQERRRRKIDRWVAKEDRVMLDDALESRTTDRFGLTLIPEAKQISLYQEALSQVEDVKLEVYKHLDKAVDESTWAIRASKEVLKPDRPIAKVITTDMTVDDWVTFYHLVIKC